LQREFLAELEELVEQLFVAIDELRREETHGPLRREVLARIFRHVHSLKGVAATAGFDDVSALAHQTETLLDGARSGRLPIEDFFVETLEEAANAISESLSAVAAGANAVPSPVLNQRLHEFSLRGNADSVDPPYGGLPADLVASLNESERQLLQEAIREDEHLYQVSADFDVKVFDKEFHELRAKLTQHGAVISALPSATGSRPDRVGFRVLCSSALELEDLQEHLNGFPAVAITKLHQGPDPGATPLPAITTPARQIETAPASLSTSAVRIEVDELDRLISASHEVFGQTVAALDLISDNLSADAEARAELKNLDAQIRQSLVSLEEQIIQLRMVSLERVMQRAIRAGRVAAKLSGKEIEFTTVGSQMRIDKMVCDAIADPLLHLVRNAVDQGLESPEERISAGKNRTGAVRIEASSAGGRVRFLVADDGRGVDPQVVSRAAVKLGLIDKGTVLSIDRSSRLIFRPGFSTAATVSTVSGRGVGLDVVETAVERAGGRVGVRTSIGHGTEFEIRLPAALSVLRALVVLSGGHRYCLETTQIVDNVELRNGAVETAASGSWRWSERLVPVTSLQELLAQPRTDSNAPLRLLICKVAGQGPSNARTSDDHHALLVEEVSETQEVLVRSLGRHAGRWPGVAGAAELRDGRVALVLDLPLLLALAQV
jgi:two-component system, chemotaxis family, sensor kinase CheA